MTKQRWLGLGLGVTVFLIAFGLALAQQLFQVSRQVPADLEVFDTTVLPDGQLVLEFRDGTPVDHIGLKRFNEGAAGTRRIFVTNETSPPISLFLSDPCHAAVDANTGQKSATSMPTCTLARGGTARRGCGTPTTWSG